MEKTIIEGNKIIAEFMGLKLIEDGLYEGLYEKGVGIFPIEKLGYGTYWNWLMPVVEKIESLHSLFPAYYLNVRISQGYVEIEGCKGFPIMFNTSIEGSKIKATHKAVVAFIKWYTAHQKETIAKTK